MSDTDVTETAGRERRPGSGTMRILRRKLRRDLVRRRWQFAAVGVTIVLGVMLFAASYDAFLNLTASYERTYDDLAFADLTISGGDEQAIGTAAAGTDGVVEVAERTQADVPFQIDEHHRLVGRIVGMPAGGQPAVNRVDVLDGSYLDPAQPTGVLVETHMADHFGLGPGDTLEVVLENGPTEVEVQGVVASAEYIFPSSSERARPSPCSPESEPPWAATRSAASSMNERSARPSSVRGMSSRTWTHPSPKCPNG